MKRGTSSPKTPKTPKAKASTPQSVPTNVVAMPAPAKPKLVKPAATRPKDKMQPSFDAIAMRAYLLFEARGGQHGHDIEDWLQAQNELMAPAKAPKRKASA